MKKFNYIYIIAIASLLFAGCYTQLATNDGVETRRVTREVYSSNQQNAQAGRDVYTDTSETYSGEYYDTTGYFDSSRPDGYYNYDYGAGYSSYYYDDFYYSYPSYSRYFWGYYPSFSVGFSWPGWYYSPFYISFGFGWYYPYYPYWGYNCFSYYYPAPYYCGYNYCYNGGYYPNYPYYYTYKDRRRDIARIRNLDGLRGGGRSNLISSRNRSSVSSVTERNHLRTGITPAAITSKNARLDASRNINVNRINSTDRAAATTSRDKNDQISRRPAERKPAVADGQEQLRPGVKRGNALDGTSNRRIIPSDRKNSADIGKSNEGRKSNGNIRPRNYPTPSVTYKPQRRPNSSGDYIPPKRNTTPRSYNNSKRNTTPKSYAPPKRNTTPRSYSPPKRSTTPRSYNPPKRNSTPKSYTPPKRNSTPRSYRPPTRNSTPRSYSPPQRSSSPPARSSGRSGGSSSGRSRR